ncbi:hypothetical protein GGE65_003368 [Skermanella aerolata]|uniref:hypothetical protein n=1 Tax=Skermanella aerolata TaxID=393310 RepID=UPI003D1B8228
MTIMKFEPKWPMAGAVFLVVALSMLAGWLPSTGKLLFEYGDLAANTLLVLDAKRSVLLTGNYSRVGFNHPGPAYIYVMAAGEYLFHDLLRLTPTPMGGLILGTAALNAGWLSLLWLLLARFSRSAGAAASGLAAFVAYTLLNEPGFLFGIWMPFLYFAPFAVFTLALARVTSGRLDALVPLTLAAGFLVHGHASFIGIIGLMIVISALVHLSATRWLSDEVWPKLVSPETVPRYRKHLIAAAAIAAVFVLPLVAQTLLHFPGPLRQYLGYGSARHSNSLAASLTYVFACWGGAAMLVPSAVLMWVLLRTGVGDRRDLGERLGFLAALAASTLAVLFYTVFAVDFLDQAYIIYFYRAVPGLLTAVTVCALHNTAPDIRRHGRLALAAVLSVALLLAFGPRRPSDSVAGIPEAHSALVEFEPGPAVLDLDNTRNWVAVWANTVSLLAYGKRVRSGAYCVRGNWQILFTEALHCPPGIAPGTPVLTVTPADGAVPGPGVLRILGLDFTRTTVP